MGMLLQNEYFAADESLIVDEILDFFVAAAQTTTSATSCIVHHLVQNAENMEKVLDDMDKNLPKNNERYSYESLGNLEFFPYLF